MTQSTRNKHKKSGHPLSWGVVGDGNTTSVYNVFTKTQLALDDPIPCCNNKPAKRMWENNKNISKYKENNVEKQKFGRLLQI